MSCAEVRARLHAYVDGELPVSEITALDAHCAECERCAPLVHDERAFRLLLRRQPREPAPPELRAKIHRRLRRERRVTTARPWVLVSAAAVAAAIVASVLLPSTRQTPPLVADLVDKHIAYAQIERPAELASSDPAEVAHWFRSRAGMRVTVPDFAPSGIRLVGARLRSEAHV